MFPTAIQECLFLGSPYDMHALAGSSLGPVESYDAAAAGDTAIACGSQNAHLVVLLRNLWRKFVD